MELPHRIVLAAPILILSPSYKKEDENGFNTDTSAGCKTTNKTAAINGNAAISGVPN